MPQPTVIHQQIGQRNRGRRHERKLVSAHAGGDAGDGMNGPSETHDEHSDARHRPTARGRRRRVDRRTVDLVLPASRMSLGRTVLLVLAFLPIVASRSEQFVGSSRPGTTVSSVNVTKNAMCPMRCVCTVMKEYAVHTDCSRCNLTLVPEDISPLTVVLKLKSNNVSRIPSGRLSKLTRLKELSLEDNRFHRLPENPLDLPPNLEMLYLNFSHVRFIHPTTFNNTRRLKVLKLDGNEIEKVPSEALSILTELEVLDLGRNRIKEIPDFAFQNLKKLVFLILQNNEISEVQDMAFAGLASLKVLEINDNRLTLLPATSFSLLTSLWELTFADNHISFLPDHAFRNNTQLSLIEMRGNPITDIGKEVFANLPHLTKLTLSDARLLKTFPELSGTSSLEHLRLDRAQIHTVPYNFCSKVPLLKTLNLKSNRLTSVPELGGCTQLLLLDLSYNYINSVEGSPFYGQERLVDLFLGNNQIYSIPADAFVGLKNLQVLDLVNNQIKYIHKDAFTAFSGLRDLNLGNNFFPELPTKGLQNLYQLKTFNNRNLKEFPSPTAFPKVHTLALSYAYHCCAFLPVLQPTPGSMTESIIWISKDNIDTSIWNTNASEIWPGHPNITSRHWELAKASGKDYAISDNIHQQYGEEYYEDYKSIYNSDENIQSRYPIQCLPQPGPFMPCEDLFGWWTLRCGIWIVFLLAMLGNGIVVIVLLFGRSKMDVPRFLVCNLAMADFFMGIYLGILAVVDASTLGEFKVFAIPWQTSTGCQIAGFLGVLSSELSVYTLSVITLERNYAITHAMHLNKRLSLKHAGYIMTCGWSFALVMAILPLFGVSDYRKFAICLPFEIEDKWSLGYVVFLILINGVAFMILMGCYLKMYCAIRGSQAWNSNDSRIAKRMALLVFTDFICWAPIAFFSLTAVFGLHLISLEEAKVFTIFVLPLNSCANPFLYAIFTKQFKKDCVLLCKRIEESRVTRGIGRCRHSSNFSNRHTPANTNSAAERKSGGEQPLCQCQAHHKATDDGVLLGHRAGWKTWALRYLLCQEDDGEQESNDYTYAIAQIQRNVERGHKRASSISSENFSSRSDSWRQGNVPLRLLERGGGGCGGGRRNSWSIARKQSQDSSMSCSRQDSSTSTFRMSRSSVSSDTSNATSRAGGFPSIRERQYLSANAEGGQPVRPAFGSIRDKTAAINGEPARLVRGLTREKPQLCRQGAVDDNCLPRVMYRSADMRPFQRSPPFGIVRGAEGLCPSCARKEASPPMAFKSKELEEKFNCFYNRLAETSHEDSSEVSVSKEEQVLLSSDQSTGDQQKANAIHEETGESDDQQDVPLQPHIEIAPQSPMARKLEQQNEKVMSWLQKEEKQMEQVRKLSQGSCTHLQISMDSVQDPHHLHVSADNIKCSSLTSIGSEHKLSSGRKVASDNSIKKLSLRSLPAMLRSLSSQSTQQKSGRKLKVMSQTQLRPKSAEQLPCSMSETVIHRKADFPPEWYRRRMRDLLERRMPEHSDSEDDDDDNVFVSRTDDHLSRGMIEVHRLVKSQPSGGSNNEEIPLIDADATQRQSSTKDD